MRNTAIKTILLEEEIAHEKELIALLKKDADRNDYGGVITLMKENISSLEYIVEHENGLTV